MIVYKLLNKITNKVYIGQTIDTIEYRWSSHISFALGKCLRKQPICYSIAHYSPTAFEIEEICSAQNQEELNFLEILFIQAHHSTESFFGYNLREGGSRGAHSEVSKKLMSDIRKGVSHGPRPATLETKLKISQSQKLRLSKITSQRLGRTLEDIFGVEKAKKMKAASAQRNIEYWEKKKSSGWKPKVKRKKIRKNLFGIDPSLYKKWITDGINNKRVSQNEAIPLGWKIGRTMGWNWPGNKNLV